MLLYWYNDSYKIYIFCKVKICQYEDKHMFRIINFLKQFTILNFQDFKDFWVWGFLNFAILYKKKIEKRFKNDRYKTNIFC